MGILEPSSEIDIYCLHLVFTPLLEKALIGFTGMWDNHQLRTCHKKTPNQLFKTGLEGIAKLSEEFGFEATELKQQVDISNNIYRRNPMSCVTFFYLLLGYC